MKAWVYVEGEADRLALLELWGGWRAQLRQKGHGIEVVPLSGKALFFKKIGARAAEKLVNASDDFVVGLPDLYPNAGYQDTVFKHANVKELQAVQKKCVKEALEKWPRIKRGAVPKMLDRFFPCALKHDLEMLLLAASEELRQVLGTRERLQGWRNPVEEQNQNNPPKRVIERLFLTKSTSKRAYRDTRDAKNVLGRVKDISSVLFTQHGSVQCPVFKGMLDWMGAQFGVPAYTAPSSTG